MENSTTILQVLKTLLDNDYPETRLYRDLIDRYFCYANGYVSKSGNAAWGKIVGAEWITEGYTSLPKGSKSYVEKEHVYPLNLMVSDLRNMNNHTIDSIRNYLDQHIIFSTITKEEDEILKAHGLQNTMPSEFFDPTSPLYGDLFARYKKCGIELKKM